jgi:hypothetical protein
MSAKSSNATQFVFQMLVIAFLTGNTSCSHVVPDDSASRIIGTWVGSYGDTLTFYGGTHSDSAFFGPVGKVRLISKMGTIDDTGEEASQMENHYWFYDDTAFFMYSCCDEWNLYRGKHMESDYITHISSTRSSHEDDAAYTRYVCTYVRLGNTAVPVKEEIIDPVMLRAVGEKEFAQYGADEKQLLQLLADVIACMAKYAASTDSGLGYGSECVDILLRADRLAAHIYGPIAEEHGIIAFDIGETGVRQIIVKTRPWMAYQYMRAYGSIR